MNVGSRVGKLHSLTVSKNYLSGDGDQAMTSKSCLHVKGIKSGCGNEGQSRGSRITQHDSRCVEQYNLE